MQRGPHAVSVPRDSSTPDVTRQAEPIDVVPAGRADTAERPLDSSDPESQASCLHLGDLELAIDLNNELQRIRILVPMGGWFNDYRGIGADGLASLAAQGDTLAMVVLGARAELAATGEDPARAVAKLSGETPAIGLPRAIFDLERLGGQREQLEVARDWYQRAALLGHLAALPYLGHVQVALGETPVTLGWIDQEAFDALPEAARYQVEVINAHTVAIGEIAPNAKSGVSGVVLDIAGPALRYKPYAKAVAAQYAVDRSAVGLPPVDIESGLATNDLRELAQKLCPEDRALLDDG
ncbi:MAG: hypothetical protein AAFQ62_09285 [Pseudomonadota bacterium]